MTPVEVWLCDDSLGPDTHVGSLMISTGRSGNAIRFQYDDAWLAGKKELAPFALEPSLGAFIGPHHPPANNALFGIFRDTSPDRWGRLLMERKEVLYSKSEGRAVRTLTEWDFLLGVADAARMGALRLFDVQAKVFIADSELPVPPLARLRELEHVVAELQRTGAEEQPDYRTWLLQVLAPGSSLGGARPKASFLDTDGSLWLAKFPANDDRRDIGQWELLASNLAVKCGLTMPRARTVRFSDQGHTFAVQRFDRAGTSRRLYASAMTLTGKGDGDPASYLDIVEAIETNGDNGRIAADLEQLYRRVLFSILIGNRDDHLRNHGFLRGSSGWRLSPAFDINPNPDKADHALAIDEADPSPLTATLTSTRDYYRLSASKASAIEKQIRAVVADWQVEATRLGIARQEIATLVPVIVAGR